LAGKCGGHEGVVTVGVAGPPEWTLARQPRGDQFVVGQLSGAEAAIDADHAGAVRQEVA
jgi:hypothetical protein